MKSKRVSQVKAMTYTNKPILMVGGSELAEPQITS